MRLFRTVPAPPRAAADPRHGPRAAALAQDAGPRQHPAHGAVRGAARHLRGARPLLGPRHGLRGAEAGPRRHRHPRQELVLDEARPRPSGDQLQGVGRQLSILAGRV